jgi:5-methylcytosine-specific restriction protein A
LARLRSPLHGQSVADEPEDFDVSAHPSAPAAASGVQSRPPRKQAGGWADPKQLPVGPSGRPLCRKCSGEIQKGSGRRTFCSDACVVEWKIRTQPEFAAEQVHARDKGICVTCARDCDALFRKIRVTKHARRKRRMDELGLPAYLLRRRRYWEVDHITPVVEGGGSCGLENLRTLCWECHRKVTRELGVRRGKIHAA